MKVTKDQIEIAKKLLKILCETGQINKDKLYSTFTDKNGINYIIKLLEQNKLICPTWNSHGDVATIRTSDSTRNAFKNNILETGYNKYEQKKEKENLEIELAKSNIEANRLNAEMAKSNAKNKRTNNIAKWINLSVGIINLGIIIWQLVKAA